MNTKNTDEYAQLFISLLDLYIAKSKKVLVATNNKTKFNKMKSQVTKGLITLMKNKDTLRSIIICNVSSIERMSNSKHTSPTGTNIPN